jgi:hypothetical protein
LTWIKGSLQLKRNNIIFHWFSELFIKYIHHTKVKGVM